MKPQTLPATPVNDWILRAHWRASTTANVRRWPYALGQG
jgi:hypothetical protein